MPRIWRRKTERIRKSSDEMERAVREVLQGSSIRSVAKANHITFSTLQRYVEKARALPEEEQFHYNPNLTVRQIFSAVQESKLADYLITCSKMHYGLTSLQTRQMAYKYAIALNLNLTEKQKDEEKLGREWLFGFLRRNPNLKLRSPEATSLSRSTSFNKFNVSKFFDNAENVFLRHNFTANDIWNCDEIGLTTVHNPPRVIAQKGLKQVGQVTSGERGQLTTMCGFINAAGNTVPPVFIFPRQRNLDVLGNSAPPGSLILGQPSGWMTAPNFLLAFKHFINSVRCSRDHPVVLFLDNHESHVSIELIDAARESGVFLVTYPPHCSHRLQPLDVSVYGPFRSRYNQACAEWMTSNGGKAITLYNVAELANKAYILAFSKQNIIKGFEKTGIWPLNRNVFSEDDFLMSSVTNHPILQSMHQNSDSTINVADSSNTDDQNVSLSNTVITEIPRPSTPEPSTSMILPEHVVPYPKAPPRKCSLIKGRKPGRTRILTDTPEKMEIEESKKRKVSKLKLDTEDRKRKTRNCSKKKKNRVAEESSTSEEDGPQYDSSSGESFEPDDPNNEFDFDLNNLTPGDFLLVKFATKSSILHYVGRLESEIQGEFEVNFLRKKGRGFVFPNVLDISVVPKSDIVLKLPAPSKSGGSERVFSVFTFDIDLSAFSNIR